ncbi:hypothetical protein [Spiroplasma phoeniceum]|nr:hypothetical protein [Spiroplasma phoeniceum]
MLSKLGKIDPTTYIRHYWNSQNNFLREKYLELCKIKCNKSLLIK